MFSRAAACLVFIWFVVVCSALLATGHGAAVFVRALPQLEGDAYLTGLSAPVTVERDRLGIPVIRGLGLEDVTTAQGFVHAQDRFFQMDLLRRQASGRLAEIVGPAVVRRDATVRRYQFEQIADQIVDQLPADHRALLDAYTNGVNAGLAQLEGPPFEYVAMSLAHQERLRPEAWQPRDCVLVALAMTRVLSAGAGAEQLRTDLRESLSKDLVDFLLPESSRFDAPMIDSGADAPPLAPPADFEFVPQAAKSTAQDEAYVVLPAALGSNNWAVAGSRTADGGALLANDMHLPLSTPNIWHRAQLEWGEGNERVRWAGVSLPGMPGIVVGSNGHVAWGFTNSFVDVQDWIIIETDPTDPSKYLAPEGPEAFGEFEARIDIAGDAHQIHRWRTTRWGVVVEGEPPRVLKWTALDPEATNLGILDLWQARTLEEAVDIMRTWRGPSQNASIASADGRIAWVVTGFLPQRIGYSGRVSTSWADGSARWAEGSDEPSRPVLLDPASGLVWSANNRTVPAVQSERLFDGWGLGCRAQRIRTVLGDRTGLTERDMLELQLDTRVEVGAPYQALAARMGAIAPPGSRARRAGELIQAWNGRADAQERGYVALKRFYRGLAQRVLNPLLAPADRTWRSWPSGMQEALLTLLEQQPAHMLPPEFASWDELGLDALHDVLRDGEPPAWGEVNRLSMRHPIALALPTWFTLLDMPRHVQAGDTWAVRVATPEFGASQRLVVSPGREDAGILHLPGGQCGNPLSPHYRRGHRAWRDGSPTPLLAGPAAHQLRLVPRRWPIASP